MSNLTHEQRLYAESLRGMLVQGYAYKGDAWGKGLAARCAWIIGEVVSDAHGRAAAVTLLDRASDAINSSMETSPAPELPVMAGLLGVDGRPLPDRWIIPAPKSEADLNPLFEMIATTFYNGKRLAEVPNG
ncbi:MAG TPA: hypothetical protein DEQ40_00360 [Oxalobacteraceae bacterium]|nr:hypothetical protein [Oxalobacteraceae bacterium]